MAQRPENSFILALIKVTRPPLILGTDYTYLEVHRLASDTEFIRESANRRGWHLNGVSTQVFETRHLDALRKIEAGTPDEHGIEPILAINGV